MAVLTRSKTAAAAAAAAGSRIGTDVFGHIGSFLPPNDAAMNLIVSVGLKGSLAIRHTYLAQNYGYLGSALQDYALSDRSLAQKRKCRSSILAWMEINGARATLDKFSTLSMLSEWDKLVPPGTWKLLSIEEEGRSMIKTTPLVLSAALFNNPAFAVELGLVNILAYLVEEQGIDVNSYHWTSFQTNDRTHLLALASLQDDKSCFHYLLSLEDTNVASPYALEHLATPATVIHYALYSKNLSPHCFEELVSHPSFDPHASWNYLSVLTKRFVADDANLSPEDSDGETFIEKARILMRAGVDPSRRPDVDYVNRLTPIEYVRKLSNGLAGDTHVRRLYYNPEMGRVLKEVLAMMLEMCGDE